MRSAREAGRTPSRSAFAQFNYATIPVILRGGSRKFFASNRCATQASDNARLANWLSQRGLCLILPPAFFRAISGMQ
jgi:hypothetical protein